MFEMMMHAVLQATFLSKCVLALLLLLSVFSWAFMAGKWLQLRRAHRVVVQQVKDFDSHDTLMGALPVVESDPKSPFFGIAQKAIREFNRINRTGDAERLIDNNVRRALHFGIAEEVGKLKSSLAFLATTSNTAPFIGLFGTVCGIMFSFQAIAKMKSVSIATVAPGIAEALIATAVGLFVAIPATCGYNIFRSKLTSIEAECITFAGQLLNRLQHEVDGHKEGIAFGGGK
ncbi:MAG: MotA/TolQ/ExbB proton channel family protein [Desulfovibrio sp.]|nr:MotA/TolQ/ExbB proton channel family protein [Desulfovibrio sp.]